MPRRSSSASTTSIRRRFAWRWGGWPTPSSRPKTKSAWDRDWASRKTRSRRSTRFAVTGRWILIAALAGCASGGGGGGGGPKPLDATPDDATLRIRLAQLLREAGKSSDALEQIRTVLRKDGKNNAARNELGLVYYTLGKYDLADLALHKAAEAEPANALFWNN